MKKILFILLAAPAFLVSCGGGKNTAAVDSVKDSLVDVTHKLSGVNASQASQLDSFFRAFNDIQSNLDEIKKKEKIITADTTRGDVSNRKDQITADIQSIYDLMVKNKQRLAAAKKNLKDSNLKIAGMEQTITLLQNQLAEKEDEITQLKDELEKLNLQLSNLSMNYQELQQQSDAQTQEINSAWYAFGTSKVLKKEGVLTDQGGFIGIGKSQTLAQNLNTNYFTKIDITQTTEIVLGAKKATLVTTHPAGSYKIEGANGHADKLTITDPTKFWSVSKYLVIVVE